MQDLLNEDDFKRPEFNPWPYFRKYYIIAVVCIIAYLIIAAMLKYVITESALGILFFLIPVVLSYVMVFRKREVLMVDNKIISMGIVYLTCIYFVPFLIGFLFLSFVVVLGLFIIWAIALLILLVPILLHATSVKKKAAQSYKI